MLVGLIIVILLSYTGNNRPWIYGKLMRCKCSSPRCFYIIQPLFSNLFLLILGMASRCMIAWQSSNCLNVSDAPNFRPLYFIPLNGSVRFNHLNIGKLIWGNTSPMFNNLSACDTVVLVWQCIVGWIFLLVQTDCLLTLSKTSKILPFSVRMASIYDGGADPAILSSIFGTSPFLVRRVSMCGTDTDMISKYQIQ